MVVLTLDPREAIQPRLIEGIVNKQMEQQLSFQDIFPTVNTDATSFVYFEDTTTAGADIASGKMGSPLDLTELAELTTIEVSPISLKMGTMNRFGYELQISQRDLRTKPFIDELSRAYDRVSFGMAKKINDDTVAVLQAVSNDITEVSGYKVWSDNDADPVTDMLSFAQAMDLEGWPYELNRLYVHKDNYYEFLKFMWNIDRAWAMDPTGGVPRQLPAVGGVSVVNTKSTQLAEGSYIGLDTNYPACTVYKFTDPKFSSNPADSRINVNQYEQEKYPHNIVIEIFAEMGIALKLPNAVSYKSSGI